MEETTNTTKNICPFCGREWLYKLVTGGKGKDRYCYHDNEADKASPTIGETTKYENHLKKRESVVARHDQGKLPRSYYSTRFDKSKQKNVPYLSPKKMMSNKEGI